MRTLFIAAICSLLAGCITSANLIAEDGRRYEVAVSGLTRGLSTEIESVKYTGKYVTNSGAGFVQTFGATPSAGVIAIGGSSGQALLTAINGDYLECGFNYADLTVLGRCKSKFGKEYVLTTD